MSSKTLTRSLLGELAEAPLPNKRPSLLEETHPSRDQAEKRCAKCGARKPLNDFYVCAKLSDGHFNKCKECYKSDVRLNYRNNIEHYKLYYRERETRPSRKAAKSAYGKRMRERHPEKRKAWGDLSNAIRDGKLIRQPCEVCGDPKSQAHHEDYSKPLDVRWLCFKHHREIGHGQIVTKF